eukprot:gene11117-12385_t
MPLYHQIILTSPKKAAPVLTDLFRKYARIVIGQGGVVRSIENHGVRALPERAKRKFVTTDGDRYFWNARYVSAIIDVPSDGLVDVNRFLKNEEAIIRHHLTRLENNFVVARGKTYRNPYLHINAASSTPLATPSPTTTA